MVDQSEQQAVPVAQEVERVIRKIDVQAECLEGYAESNGFSTKPIPSVFHFQAAHFRDIANELRMQLSLPLPCKSGEGTGLGHEYGPSRVGHGEAQCVHCLATNRENAAIAPNVCSARAKLTLTPDATQTREAELVELGREAEQLLCIPEYSQKAHADMVKRLLAALNARGGA